MPSAVDRRMTFVPRKEQTTDPSRLIDIELKQLRDDFSQQANTLKNSGITADAHNRILAGWQSKYDQAKTQLTENKTQLELARRMERAGEVPSGYAKSIGFDVLGMRQPPTTTRQPSAVGMSPGMQENYYEMFAGEKVRKELTTDVTPGTGWAPWNWGGKSINPKKMKALYMRQRNIANFGASYNAAKLPGFNCAFEQAMGQEEDTRVVFETLLEQDPQMKAAFAPNTDLNRAFLSKFKGVSPLGRGVAAKLPKQPQQAPEPIRQYSQSRGQTRVSYDGGATWQIE